MEKNVDLAEIVAFLDSYCRNGEFKDFDGAFNGLQFENSGSVSKIATAVDAGIAEIELAAHLGADLLLVHHGMFWNPPIPVVGPSYHKIKALMDNDISVYSVHLPLDDHGELGNNVLITEALGLRKIGRCFPCGEIDIGVLAAGPQGGIETLSTRLRKLFPDTYKEILFGSSKPKKIAICSGSCSDAVEAMPGLGVDTLVCGELRQRCFSMAQELHLNLFPCGHYATECFGVMALGELLARRFGLQSHFLEMRNPL